MSRVAALLNALGTESQPDDLAQLLDDGWAVDGGVIQFYGDMSDNPSPLPDAPGASASNLGLRIGDVILAFGTATTYAELAAEAAAEAAAGTASTKARSKVAPFLVLKRDSWPSSTPARTPP